MKLTLNCMLAVSIALLGSFAADEARSDQIRVPHVFIDGEPARAGTVNSNFDTLEDESNSQDARIEALEAKFVSTWRSIGRADRVTIDHELGVIPSNVVVQVAASTSPTVVHMGGHMHTFGNETGGRGVIATNITASSLVVRAGDSQFCPVFDTFVASGSSDGANRVCLGTGFVRVIVYP